MRQKPNLEGTFQKAGIGVAAACVGVFLMCCILGLLVLQELVPIRAAPAAAVCLGGVCVFTACYFTAREIPQSRLPVSLGMALTFSLLCLVVKTALFSGWEMHIGWPAAVPFLASAAAGLLASRKRKRRR